jgi:alpha-D-xyloside xylohydrolase
LHSKYISLCGLSFVSCLVRRRKGAIRTALRLIVVLIISTFACKTAQAASPVVSFQQNQDGVTFTLQTGVLQLDVNNGMVRVRYSVLSPLPAKSSLIVNGSWPAQTSFTVTNSSSAVTLTTSSLNVIVEKSTSAITFQDLQGNTLLAENPNSNRSMTPATVFGLSTYTLQTVFDSPSTEALYGLGNFQDGTVNRKGQNETMDQRNIGGTGAEIGLPMLLSTRGYGLLWDTYAKSSFFGGNGSDTPASEFRFQIEAGNMIDYYFIYGPSFDDIIASYRTLTGRAPLFPKWAYGLFQSYNRYASQSELTNVVNTYRADKIPLDVIVQDWHYWDPAPWGSHVMDPTRYPNPAQMLSTFHSQNIHGMISVWAYFQAGSSNYTQLVNNNSLYTSQGHYYDAYSATGRRLYWQQIQNDLFNNYGWDAWWLDSDEWDTGFPECCFDRHNVETGLGSGSLFYNAYPLMHTTGIYTGQRADTSAKRVFILSRSSYPGQQRNAAASWSGDTNSDWSTFARQIPAGLDFSVAGIPYWTTDIGGYEGTAWSSASENELFTRWFQYGAFCPIFRIHGQGHKELYGSQWSASTKANLLLIDTLRYRLMPYIYSLAAMATNQGYTLMRPLVMDYRSDANVHDIADQFMFGPAILVNPVTQQGATSRSVYLPGGEWVDFWTGDSLPGGQTIVASAPLSEMPLYVKAGSIVPMGPNIQYATQSADPLEIRVYRGANGSFTLYEDEGDNYDYEQGTSASIPMSYDDATGVLTIGSRTGSFPGMLNSRTVNVVFVQPGYGTGASVTSSPQTATYSGSPITFAFAPHQSSAPFGGTPAAIPGTVQAENYDTGGQGVAFNVATVNGTANSYRPDGVDLEVTSDVGGGDDLGWNYAGQWFNYTVNVSTAGVYTVTFRVASIGAINSALHIANSAGTNLTGEVNIPSTGGFGTWVNVTATLSLPAGRQILTLVDDNGSGNYNLNYMTFAGLSEAPYGGTPAAIPGTVQAENYDVGGQGVGYSVNSVNGTANSYRSDGVDIETTSDTGGGFNLGWTGAGQWFRYTVNVASARTYTVSFRVAAPTAVSDAFHISNSSGANLSGSISIPATGGWQTWSTVTARITLPAGTQTLTLNEDNGGWNINYTTFAGMAEGPFGGMPAAIPGAVQAENYDVGGQGIAYSVNSVNGTANTYRSDGVDLETTSDTGGGFNLGWTGAGQWFRYTVNVASPRTYTVSFRVAAPAAVTNAFHISNSSGANLSGSISIPATGGWQTWSTVTTTVTLPAGQQVLTLNQDNGGWNINYMSYQ